MQAISTNTRKLTITDYLLATLLVLITLACIAPIWHTVAVSLSDKSAVEGGKVLFVPVDFTWNAYLKILDDAKFFRAFAVSLERVVLGAGIQFLLTVLMAYPLSMNAREFKGRNVYMWFIVFTMLFGGGLIPWYLVVKSLGMLNSIWALVIPGAVPVFNVILVMNFMRNLPKELKEAAYIDGSGPWHLLLRIYIPVAVPALATVTLFSIVAHWNDFFQGLILMSKPENYPLQTYIQQLVVQLDLNETDSDKLEQAAKLSNKSLNAAKIFVTIIPVLLVYPFLQRYFIHGITLGSVKE
ncbi:carbohydrate ABC transporter permease [Cohnella sp. LGH]|uniref:Multiple sugar transport system permease protein/putative aldouronate transport system permease protein n=1 Tax=Cohnella phaseoli TaxID=456490 RepID=A0A3D9KA07_9BACL|nr:multiple sugar transport system permease protein/putative aldouronate transport system permease protein [Cohnella phaseoli]